jgi:glycosyltransferase involved in cell wall biosynthesis
MHITIVQGAFLPVPPLRGGAMEKLWFELGKQLSCQGHTVCHISRCFPNLPKDEVIQGVRHLRLKGYDTPANGVYLKILDLFYSLRVIRRLPAADILITNTFWMPLLAGWNQSRVGRLVVDVNRMPKGQMFLYSQASSLRAPSSVVHQAIVREAPWLKNRVRTIPNPLSYLAPFVDIKGKSNIILYCGRLHPEKGIELLIHSFRLACRNGLIGWTLRMVGPADSAAGGGGLDWLHALIDTHASSELPIDWQGPIYDQDKLQHQYQQASVFVYPSLADQGEALPLAPLEAMASGAVPIVSSLACFRDFIRPGVNGLVFNHLAFDAPMLLANNILELANNKIQREVMSQAALDVRQSHNPAIIAAEFLSCFEELIRQRPPTPERGLPVKFP